MAALDFPSNPVAGQASGTYDTGTGTVYIWDGSTWNIQTDAGSYLSTTSGGNMQGSIQFVNSGVNTTLLNVDGSINATNDVSLGAQADLNLAGGDINPTVPTNINLVDASGLALRVMNGTDEFLRFRTDTDKIVTANELEIDGGLNIDSDVDLGANVDCTANVNITIGDNSALALRVMEGTTEYVRFNTTDGTEVVDFSKNVKLDGGVDCTKDINIVQGTGNTDINVENEKGSALRVMNLGGGELFRFNTNVTPNLADFTCAVKLDGDVEAAFGTLTVSQDLNVLLPASSSDAIDFTPSDDATEFALRINTSAQQLITDYDIYNDNNDAIIALGGTIAAPQLKFTPGKIEGTGMLQFATTSSTLPLVFSSNTNYTFLAPDSTTAMTRFVVQATGDNTINIPDVAGDMAVDQSNGIHFSLLQQTGSAGFPTNTGTSHFYSDVSIGFTGTASQLASNQHVSKFTVQRNFAGNEGGLIVKGGRPGEAGNGTQNILAVHYQDVVAGDDIRYHGSTANSHSLQNKSSVSNPSFNIVPNGNNTYNLGSDTNKWNNAYINLLHVGNYNFPTTDGSANQVLATDGSGQLSFATVNAGNVTGATQTTGTFTATMTGATSAPNAAQTTTGNYIRIGDLVTVYIAYTNLNVQGASGTVQITGLPFNIENLSSGSGGQFTEPIGSLWFDKDEIFSTQRSVSVFGVANTTNVQFVAQGTQGYLTYGDTTAASSLRFEFELSYVTDAA